MARERYVFDRETSRLVDAAEYYARKAECQYRAMSDLPAPMVIGDGIEIKSMVDGKVYTSKSALRKSYRQAGYIEVGNEELKPGPKPKPDRKAIKETVARSLNQVGVSV